MSYLSVGSILDHTVDPNPSSGPHLDVKINRLYGDKGHVNPLDKPELLNRIRIGPNRNLLSDYTITSGYGPRDTGIAGASRYHKGIDYGIDAGTELYWEGEGRYSPENSIGVIYTNDSKGNPYEILLTHTQLGESNSGVSSASTPTNATPVTPQQEAVERVQNYANMSKAELDAAYDGMRNDPAKARIEGMKMHKAFFGKP